MFRLEKISQLLQLAYWLLHLKKENWHDIKETSCKVDKHHRAEDDAADDIRPAVRRSSKPGPKVAYFLWHNLLMQYLATYPTAKFFTFPILIFTFCTLNG